MTDKERKLEALEKELMVWNIMRAEIKPVLTKVQAVELKHTKYARKKVEHHLSEAMEIISTKLMELYYDMEAIKNDATNN